MPSTTKIKSQSYKSKKKDPWYKKQLWKTHLRKAQLIRQPVCQDCLSEGKLNDKQLEIDHNIPWKTGKTESERWRLFTDIKNLVTRCKRHHSIKTRNEN